MTEPTERKINNARKAFDPMLHCGLTMDRSPEKYNANIVKCKAKIDELEELQRQRPLTKVESITLGRKINRKNIAEKNLQKIAEQGEDTRPCMKTKGQGTDHPSVGRCRWHCACKGRPDGHLTQHGRRLKDKKLQDLMDEIDASGRDILDISPTVLLLEAKLELFVNEKTDFTPETVKSLTLIADQLRKTVETINNKKFQVSITMETFNLLMERMAAVLMKYVTDPEILDRISSDWKKISVETGSKRSRAQLGAGTEI